MLDVFRRRDPIYVAPSQAEAKGRYDHRWESPIPTYGQWRDEARQFQHVGGK